MNRKNTTQARELLDDSRELSSEDAEWLRLFASSLETSWREAERSSHHALLAIFATWVASFAIGAGFISEVSIGSFKIGNIDRLLLTAPPLLAVFVYRYILFKTSSMGAFGVMCRICRRAMPAVFASDLYRFLRVHSFHGAEFALRPPKGGGVARSFAVAWIFIVVTGAIIGSLAMIAHATDLLRLSQKWTNGTVIASGLIALLIWLRGLLIISSAKLPETAPNLRLEADA